MSSKPVIGRTEKNRMNKRTLDALEYGRIRDQIAGFCLSEEGRESFSLIGPSADPAEVSRRKNLAGAWLAALASERPPAFSAWPPIRPCLPRLTVEGASLVMDEFLSLGLFADAADALRSWASSRESQTASGRRDSLALGAGAGTGRFDSLDGALIESALAIPDLSPVSEAIFRIIDRSGELRDLPELRAIKESIRKIRQDIDRLVNRYLTDDIMKSALQSNLPTIRDGRQVIALRANFRGRVRGIVHEVSQSGQTVYVEPEDVIDRNNDLVTEEHRLSREVARILRELTARIAPLHADLELGLERMVFHDGQRAVASWGAANRCCFARDRAPDAAPESPPAIKLRQARHPLLKDRAVPIDLAFTPPARVLIITGPNTGGKTVSLKTAALFALINQSGWPVPAADPTALPIFDFVGCDIGDEQSLDQSLSTFSGHMKNVAEILESATDRSLVLLDELGSGTDPQEGSAIAMAVLDALLERGATVLATTHHGILKNYGYTHESCVNASVDFDQTTLSPTYRILMGVPGESHALDIAARNGLAPAIVARARSYLQEERADVSALIRGLTAKHEEIDRLEKEKRDEEREIREKRRRVDLKDLQLRQREQELREGGVRRLDNLLEESRKRLENLVRELREGELTRDKTVGVKEWIAEFGALVDAERSTLRSESDQLASDTAALESIAPDSGVPGEGVGRKARAAPRGASSAAQPTSVPDFAPGVDVYVGPSRRRGTILRSASGNRWVVTVGTLKMTVKANELSAVPVAPGAQKATVSVVADLSGDDVPAFELRLLGLRQEEAMRALQRQLDLASMKGLKEFSVVHGKGHGILQQAAHDMLAHYPAVKEFHFALPEAGGTGKTIVTMR